MSFQTEERLRAAEERKAANWADVRRMGRRYFWAAMLPGLFLIWAAGYAYGGLSACLPAARPSETISNQGVEQ